MYLLKTRKGSDKEMRYYLISLLIHTVLIVAFFINILNNKYKIPEAKPIPINIIALSIENNAISQEDPLPKELQGLEKKSENLKKEESQNRKTLPTASDSQIKKPILTEKKTPLDRDLNLAQISADNSELKSELKNNSNSEEMKSSEHTLNNSSEFITSSGGKIGANQNISGLLYEIISSPEPQYPIQAKKIRLKEEVVIKARFLVGLDGKVESVEILSGTDRYGFRNEVQKSLKFWKFKPIIYKNENIKLYFYKDFTFQQK